MLGIVKRKETSMKLKEFLDTVQLPDDRVAVFKYDTWEGAPEFSCDIKYLGSDCCSDLWDKEVKGICCGGELARCELEDWETGNIMEIALDWDYDEDCDFGDDPEFLTDVLEARARAREKIEAEKHKVTVTASVSKTFRVISSSEHDAEQKMNELLRNFKFNLEHMSAGFGLDTFEVKTYEHGAGGYAGELIDPSDYL